MEKYYIYGKLNKEAIIKQYTPIQTDTASISIDNQRNTIKVDVVKVPNKLTIKDAEQIFGSFDGSSEVIIDLSQYATDEDVARLQEFTNTHFFASAELKADSPESNNLIFRDYNGNVITTLELSPFIQQQSDLSVTDTRKETFIKNKNTRFLVNDGDGSILDNGEYDTYTLKSYTDASDDAIKSDFNTFKDEVSEILRQKLDKENANRSITKNITLAERDADPDYFAFNTTAINLNTLSTDESSIVFPIANSDNSGLMSSQDVEAIRDLTQRVSQIEGKTTRLLYSDKENPTAAEINSFVEAAGYTSPFEGIAVVVAGTYHIWHYYENDSIGWRDDGQDTVSIFTNDIAGIIKGSTEDGKIYAETNGVGSVNGWTDLKGRITGTENNISDLNSELTQVKEDIIDINTSISHIQDNITEVARDTEVDNTTINRNSNNKLRAIGLNDTISNQVITANDIWLACSIERTV